MEIAQRSEAVMLSIVVLGIILVVASLARVAAIYVALRHTSSRDRAPILRALADCFRHWKR